MWAKRRKQVPNKFIGIKVKKQVPNKIIKVKKQVQNKFIGKKPNQINVQPPHIEVQKEKTYRRCIYHDLCCLRLCRRACTSCRGMPTLRRFPHGGVRWSHWVRLCDQIISVDGTFVN
jgi:hypothetical protein